MKMKFFHASIPVTACLLGFLAIVVPGRMPNVSAAPKAAAPDLHCKSAAACASVSNRGSGVGLNGRAENNSAIAGSTYASSWSPIAINGFPLTFTAGVTGNDFSSTSNATNQNSGLAGFSANSVGIYGVTANACNCGAGTDVDTFSVTPAIFGFDAGPNNGFAGPANAGIGGQSLSRVGGIFLSRSGYGAVGRTFTGTGVLGVSRAAGGVALAATSLKGGPLFRAFNATHEVASLDSSGNLVIAGGIRTGEAPQFTTKSAMGTSVVTYGARQSMSTVEDFGRAQMRAGYAEVRLDPAFVQLIDQHTGYMVFITAEGDNRGLYVANKTYSGFSVREAQGGRNGLQLSYRIVARAFGAHDLRFTVAPGSATVPASSLTNPNNRAQSSLRRIAE